MRSQEQYTKWKHKRDKEQNAYPLPLSRPWSELSAERADGRFRAENVSYELEDVIQRAGLEYVVVMLQDICQEQACAYEDGIEGFFPKDKRLAAGFDFWARGLDQMLGRRPPEERAAAAYVDCPENLKVLEEYAKRKPKRGGPLLKAYKAKVRAERKAR